MKFTEEHFNKLVDLQENFFGNDILSQADGGGSLQETIRSHDRGLHDFIVYRDLENQAVALINPATREWAHEQFVEAEKKFTWHIGEAGNVINFINGDWYLDDRLNFDDVQTHFTEREIENSPFIPSWFNKEEVK